MVVMINQRIESRKITEFNWAPLVLREDPKNCFLLNNLDFENIYKMNNGNEKGNFKKF